MESLYESWAKRNLSWERRHQSTVVDVFCDYGKEVASWKLVVKFSERVMRFSLSRSSSDYITIGQSHWLKTETKRKYLVKPFSIGEISRIVSAETHIATCVVTSLQH